jgi:hypothetical protein
VKARNCILFCNVTHFVVFRIFGIHLC